MSNEMTPSEKLVYQLCKKTFLSLWSIPNPLREDSNKELCNLIVISKPNILIFSVKEIHIKDSGNLEVDIKRWNRKALEDSFHQLSGAERALKNGVKIKNKEGKAIDLPNFNTSSVFKIAVAIGRGEKFPLNFGASKNVDGFIHTFDELSLPILLQELDTITDFVEYLIQKENYYKQSHKIVAFGEEDMLAFFLKNNRKFPETFDLMIIGEGSWSEFYKRKDYFARKEAEKISYLWDHIIEFFNQDAVSGMLILNDKDTDYEKALRILSKENRFSRRMLSDSFFGLLKNVESKSRVTLSPSGILYVFFVMESIENDLESRKHRNTELFARCFVARYKFPDSKIVIGLATEPLDKKKRSYDLVYFEKSVWTDTDTLKATKIIEEMGVFKNMKVQHEDIKEYPD